MVGRCGGSAKCAVPEKLVFRLCGFAACHSEERSDEESRYWQDSARFFASATLRLRMTVPQLYVDRVLDRRQTGYGDSASVFPSATGLVFMRDSSLAA